MAGLKIDVDLIAGKDMAFAALKIVELYVNNSGDKVNVNQQPDGSLKFEFESDQGKPNEMLRAQWISTYKRNGRGEHLYSCSNCKHLGQKSNYCPTCGARMNDAPAGEDLSEKYKTAAMLDGYKIATVLTEPTPAAGTEENPHTNNDYSSGPFADMYKKFIDVK